jgi:membrane protease YdiL (CAAX protease family)
MNLGYFMFVGVMTYGLIEWVRNRSVSDLFGLRRLRPANIVVLSIIGGVFSLLLCGWIVGDFANRYLESLFGELDLQEPVKMLRESESPVHLILAVVMACVAAPFVEELLFRGYMYRTLRELTHPVFSAPPHNRLRGDAMPLGSHRHARFLQRGQHRPDDDRHRRVKGVTS